MKPKKYLRFYGTHPENYDKEVQATLQQRGIQSTGRSHIASMGICLFNKDVLTDYLLVYGTW